MTADDNKKDDLANKLSAGSKNYNDDVIDIDAGDDFEDEDIASAAEEGDDDSFDFDEKPAKKGKSGGGVKKLAAPVLVLAVAAGIGGFIVMNPQILGGEKKTAPAPEKAPVVAQAPEQAVPLPPVVEDTGMPPQPVIPDAAQPAVPRAPDSPAPVETAVAAPPSVDAFEDISAPSVPDKASDAFGGDITETPVQAVAANAKVIPVVPVIPPVTEPPPVPTPARAAPAVSATAMVEKVESQEIADSVEIKASSMAAPVAPPPSVPMEVTSPVAPPPFPTPAEVSAAEFSSATPVAPPDTAAAPFMPGMQGATPGTPSPAPVTAAATNPAAPPAVVPDPNENVYYDATVDVPTGALATAVGPRKLDPTLEPASRYVVVEKNRKASDPEALLVSANRALDLGMYNSALEMFDQLYAKNKRDPRILMGRAVAQQHSGMPEQAIGTYEEILDLNPGNTDAMVNMMGLIREQYPSVALRRLLNLYEKHPNNSGIAAQIGITQADLGYYDDAMRYLGIAETMDPKNAQHSFNMAVIADRQGQRDKAIQLYERALETDAMYGASRSIPRENIYDRLATLRRR